MYYNDQDFNNKIMLTLCLQYICQIKNTSLIIKRHLWEHLYERHFSMVLCEIVAYFGFHKIKENFKHTNSLLKIVFAADTSMSLDALLKLLILGEVLQLLMMVGLQSLTSVNSFSYFLHSWQPIQLNSEKYL